MLLYSFSSLQENKNFYHKTFVKLSSIYNTKRKNAGTFFINLAGMYYHHYHPK